MDLHGANLRRVDLRGAFLYEADLREVNLGGANLREVDLRGANLREVDLRGANLRGVNLSEANLGGADLRGAFLYETVLRRADLRGVDLSKSRLRETVFADINLAEVKGLNTCHYEGPSVLDFRTLQQSGSLPLVFLQGCGLPDLLIDYLPSSLNQPIQYYSCFISYSSKDEDFAQRLHADLQNKAVHYTHLELQNRCPHLVR